MVTASLPSVASISSIPLLPSTSLPWSGSSSIAPATSSPATTITSAATAAGPHFPSLTTLLGTPLSSFPEPAVSSLASPLLISPALPPVPAKVVEKARKGAFVDFKEFLTDNNLLLQRIQELSQVGAIPAAAQPLLSSSRMREVSDPLTWASCFLAFMAARTKHEETCHLAAYGMIILQLVRKHGGSGWLLYDRQFRLQQEAGAGLSWVEINPSLLAATVLGQSSERISCSCHLCLAPDHTREDCALASLDYNKPSPALPANRPSPHSLRPSRRPGPYRTSGPCYRFNSHGGCHSSSCRFEHVCSGCFLPGHIHVVANCPDVKGRSKTRQMEMRHGVSPQGKPRTGSDKRM